MNALWLWAIVAAYCLVAELVARRRRPRIDRWRRHGPCHHKWRTRGDRVVCVRCGELTVRLATGMRLRLRRDDPFHPARLRRWRDDQLRASYDFYARHPERACEAAALAAELARRGG